MNIRDILRYAMFGRVEVFGKANAADFAPDSEGSKRFATLSQIIHDVGSAAAGQQYGRALLKGTLLERLHQNVRNIARTASAIAQDEPHFAESFHAPRKARQAELVFAVDAMLKQLNKPGVAAKFIVHHLPADFVQKLAADRDAVVNAQDVMEGDDQDGSLSTFAVERLTRAGMKEVKYLDAIVCNQYVENPDKLRNWARASAVERPARRKKKPASSPTADAMPAASNPTAGAEPAAPAGQTPGGASV